MLQCLISKGYSPIFTKLPFCLQMHIVSYVPQLPKLPRFIWKAIHLHYEKRMCERCGKILLVRHKKYICTCYSRKKKFTSPIRKMQLYVRPLHIFKKHWSTFGELEYYLENSFHLVLVGSNQPEFVYSLKRILNKRSRLATILLYLQYEKDIQELSDVLIRKRVNTNTCLRHFLDTFSSYSLQEHITLSRAFGRQYTKNEYVRVLPLGY